MLVHDNHLKRGLNLLKLFSENCAGAPQTSGVIIAQDRFFAIIPKRSDVDIAFGHSRRTHRRAASTPAICHNQT